MSNSIDFNFIIRQLRIYTGSLLFFYALTHLLNHSVNVVSIEAADFVRENYFHLIWKNPVAYFLLYASLAIHIILGFYSILTKKSFKITGREWIQILFPVLALLVLLQHIAGGFLLTRFEVDIKYSLLYALLSSDPNELVAGAVLFSLMVIFIWVHGVIGIHGLLKFNFKSYQRYMFGFKFIYWFVPIGAVLGFIAGLRETSVLATIENLKGNENFIMSFFGAIPQEAFAYIAPVEPLVMNNYPVFVLAVLVLCILNVVRARYFGRVKISYPGGNEFSVPRGTTILEASRLAGIPHVSVCGGKGRCTTCRVKVVSGIEDVSEPNAHEARVIKRLGLDADVRLACQLKPSKNLSVIPLINPETKEIKTRSPVGLSGKEKETVVVFIDLREFTKLSEKKLPYDVVYILNKYYSVCGEIIESNKGRLDKFIGDGIMAIFDGSENSSENCKNSIKAAQMISNAIKDLNIEMKSDFSEELRFGIGIHVGNTIVGMMGYGQTVSETVVGDNVNIAARLEEMNKKYGSELVVSKDVLVAANINTNQFTNEKIKIRGRKEELEIYSLEYAHNLEM
jgi:adenylate cyclase